MNWVNQVSQVNQVNQVSRVKLGPCLARTSARVAPIRPRMLPMLRRRKKSDQNIVEKESHNFGALDACDPNVIILWMIHSTQGEADNASWQSIWWQRRPWKIPALPFGRWPAPQSLCANCSISMTLSSWHILHIFPQHRCDVELNKMEMIWDRFCDQQIP